MSSTSPPYRHVIITECEQTLEFFLIGEKWYISLLLTCTSLKKKSLAVRCGAPAFSS